MRVSLQWFYESDDFPVGQCFWPGKNGYYPWEEACPPSIVELQPLLYEPFRARRGRHIN